MGSRVPEALLRPFLGSFSGSGAREPLALHEPLAAALEVPEVSARRGVLRRHEQGAPGRTRVLMVGYQPGRRHRGTEGRRRSDPEEHQVRVAELPQGDSGSRPGHPKPESSRTSRNTAGERGRRSGTRAPSDVRPLNLGTPYPGSRTLDGAAPERDPWPCARRSASPARSTHEPRSSGRRQSSPRELPDGGFESPH